ncbi:MAG: M48 family metalloprotease [Marinicellaceae bacterium]
MKNRLLITIYSFALLISSVQLGYANDFNLPDLGTPSDSSLSPVQEKEIRDSIINQIYQYNLVMTDPIIADYIKQLGFRLAANSEDPEAPFDFFIVNQNVVNASAYPGGLIIIYSGLFLKSDTESELAGVVAHEIAHATQRHISRFYANSKKNIIPTILGLVGAAVAAQASDSPDAPVAVLAASSALQQQNIINFTRGNEYEADRVGISTLKKSNFNPLGMAGFFEKLMRDRPIDERYQLPEYLRTHPLSINRVSEAKNRAHSDTPIEYNESELYPLVKERIRVFAKNTDIDQTAYYRDKYQESSLVDITNAELYGYALAAYLSHDYQTASKVIAQVQKTDRTSLIISILEVKIQSAIDWSKGKLRFDQLLRLYPTSPVVIEPYIQLLHKSNNIEDRKEARDLARKLVDIYPDNANYYSLLAISNQNLGKSIEANEALAMREHIIHNNYKAVRILKNILKSELDYYQRARIESKITKFENLISDRERNYEKSQELPESRR